MNDHEIEKMLSTDDASFLSPQNAAQIQRKYYPFVEKYIKHKSPYIRSTALDFLLFIKQPWCLPLFLRSMRDPVVTNRAKAADGVEQLSLSDSRKTVLDELAFQNMQYSGEELLPTEGLILTIGTIGIKDDIPLFVSLFRKEREPSLKVAYQKALAKLGYEPAIKEIEHEITYGETEEKRKALEKIEYIGNKNWVSMVVPLLLDETVAIRFSIGRVVVKRRICELAINTLREIDTTHTIPFDDPYATKGPIPYTDDQIQLVRELYGLESTEEE